MASMLNLTLTDELQSFIDDHCGEGTLYATPDEFIRDLIRQRKLQIEAEKLREGIIEGYRDAIEGRVFEYNGNLQDLLDKVDR